MCRAAVSPATPCKSGHVPISRKRTAQILSRAHHLASQMASATASLLPLKPRFWVQYCTQLTTLADSGVNHPRTWYSTTQCTPWWERAAVLPNQNHRSHPEGTPKLATRSHPGLLMTDTRTKTWPGPSTTVEPQQHVRQVNWLFEGNDGYGEVS